METDDTYVPDERYAAHLEHFPEACVELVLEHDGGVLLARRTNPPADGEWFWPGSRLYKGETFEEAVHRIGHEELSIAVTVRRQLGAHAHFWDETPFEGASSRHTVNVVYLVAAADPIAAIDLDDQHDAYRFVDRIEPDMHPYVAEYLRAHAILDDD